MVIETGFVEPKTAKMAFDPEGQHHRGQQLTGDEAIYDSIDLKPTTIAAIGNFKIATGICCMALFVTALRTCLRRWRR